MYPCTYLGLRIQRTSQSDTCPLPSRKCDTLLSDFWYRVNVICASRKATSAHTSHISGLKNLQIPIQCTRVDDSMIARLIVAKLGPKDDIVTDRCVLEP